jgi:hypothetical protein
MRLMTPVWLVLVGLMSASIRVSAAGGEQVDHGVQSSRGLADWRSTQQIWWSNEALIKETIISTLLLAQTEPHLLHSKYFTTLESNVGGLLLILDRDSSSASMRMLTSLSSFNLGEANNEIYRCIILREGVNIQPNLEAAYQSGSNECIRAFGANAETQSYMCLSPEQHKRRLKLFLSDVSKNTSCVIEK